MNDTTWKLAFDPTAAALTHLIVDEQHTVVAGRKAIIYPKWGAFYEHTLVYYSVQGSTDELFDSVENKVIYPIAMDLDVELSRLSAKAVYRSFILDLTNFAGNTNFLITYQTPGGDSCINDEHLENARVAGLTPQKANYKDIIGLPKTFESGEHQERAQLLYGLKDLVDRIDKITAIAANGFAEHKKAHELIGRYFTNKFEQYYNLNKTVLIKKDTTGKATYEFDAKVKAGEIASMAVGSIKIVDVNQIKFNWLASKSKLLNGKYNLYQYVLDWHINYQWWNAAKALGDYINALPSDFNITVASMPSTSNLETNQIAECLNYKYLTSTVSPYNAEAGMCFHFNSACAFRTQHQALNNDNIVIKFVNPANTVQSAVNGIIEHTNVDAYKSVFKLNNTLTDVYTSKAVLLHKDASLYKSSMTATNFIEPSETGFAFFAVLQYRPEKSFTLLCHIRDRIYIASDPLMGIAIGIIDLGSGKWITYKKVPFKANTDTIIGLNFDIEHKHIYYYAPDQSFDPYKKTTADYIDVVKLNEIEIFNCQEVFPKVEFVHRYSTSTNENRLIKQVSIFNKSISVNVFMMMHKKFLFSHYAGLNNNKHPIGFARHNVNFYE